MYPRCLTYTLILLFSLAAFADENCLTMGVDYAGVHGLFQGCGYRLTNGYSFTAQAGTAVRLTADTTLCTQTEPVGNVTDSGNPSSTERRNYIVSVTPLDEATDVTFPGSDVTVQGGTHTRYNVNVDYYEGLGKPVRSVMRGVTPTGNDLVTGIGYDPYGREFRISLTVPVETGNYPSDPFAEASDFYSDSYAYTETIIESSPLNRIMGHRKAGDGYNQHPSSATYLTNGGGEVKLFSVVNGQLSLNGHYAEGRLYKTLLADEDGKETAIYKDFDGRIVLSRRYDSGNNVDTYHVYDDLGNLCYVLPPPASASIGSGVTPDSAAVMRKYAYLYKYDARGNCIEKRTPGCEPVFMAYDKFNRLVICQDGNQRQRNIATATAYDKMNRIVYTAVKGDVTSFESLRSTYASRTVNENLYSTGLLGTGYTSNMHTGITRMLTVRYYDNHNFISRLKSSEQENLQYAATDGYDSMWSSSNGLLTGERVYSLADDTSYVAKAYYHDSFCRTLQRRECNAMGGFDKTFLKYSFAGKPIKVLRQHTDSIYTFDELYTYGYDHADRLTTVKYKLGQRSEITLASYTYDELGRIAQKKSYDRALGVTNYSYNIQDQITSIDANYYDKHYHYADLTGSGASPLYNGDVSQCVTLAGATVIDSVRYSYDSLDRLVSETNLANTGTLSAAWEYDELSNVTHIERYDKNGVTIDNLDITYNGNQIETVTDYGTDADYYSTMEYHDGSAELEPYGQMLVGTAPQSQQYDLLREHQYDANGNMTADLDRKIVTIRYNLLNLPDTVQFFDGSQTVNHYLADGTKVSTTHYTVLSSAIIPIGSVCIIDTVAGVTRSGNAYCGNIEYDTDFNGTPTLKRVFNSEGFITNYNTSGIPVYISRDIQGSLLSAWTLNGYYPIQYADYYADGLIKNCSSGYNAQPHFYNFKELVKMHGYDCYDYGARHSQAALGRFTSPDPLAEKYYGISPYALCGGNPVRYVDLDGRDIWEINSTGEVVSRTTNTDVDRFEFVNADGSKNGIQFKYGVVEDTRSQKVKDQSMDVYKIRGDENAKSLYEFFVDGTSENAVEWSWFETGIEGDNGLNFISTSHEKGKDSSATELFENQLSNGYTIRSHTHNHPSGSHNSSKEDKKFYGRMDEMFNYNKKWKGGTHTPPKLQIYTNDGFFNVSHKKK